MVYHSNGDYARASELYRASIKAWEEATDKPPEDYEIVASNYAEATITLRLSVSEITRGSGEPRYTHQLLRLVEDQSWTPRGLR